MAFFRKDEIMILYNSVEEFIELFVDENIEISTVYDDKSIVARAQIKLFNKLNLNKQILYKNWTKKIKQKKVVIVFAPVEIEVLKNIKKLNPTVHIIYWYWNPAYRIGRPNEDYHNLAELWTFDPDDCPRYNMKFNTTFYFNSIKQEKPDLKYDTVFVGRNKKRKTELLKLKTEFLEKGINPFFYIVPHHGDPEFKTIKPIPYNDYLQLIFKSKSILDIMPESQSGLTLRVMEALFFQKKLITNNPRIVNEKFYNPQNIFILGKDNHTELNEFINSDYMEVDRRMVESYDVNHWLNRFGIENEHNT